MTSNLIINLNKVRGASQSCIPERATILFDYFAPESESGETQQRPLVRVTTDSLKRTNDGDWMFRGVNLYRINESGKGIAGAIRTYRLSRINGIVRQP